MFDPFCLHSLTINLEKCTFASSQVENLGHAVSNSSSAPLRHLRQPTSPPCSVSFPESTSTGSSSKEMLSFFILSLMGSVGIQSIYPGCPGWTMSSAMPSLPWLSFLIWCILFPSSRFLWWLMLQTLTWELFFSSRFFVFLSSFNKIEIFLELFFSSMVSWYLWYGYELNQSALLDSLFRG